MIKTLQNHTIAYNPIREHISLRFSVCADDDEKLKNILNYLCNNSFNQQISRCLVFVRTRKQAEECSEIFQKLQGKGSNIFNSGYFHAGMNAEERHEVYDAYKVGSVSVLFATKAFGMGMDIPNIHFVFHHGPSGTLEDYLQEVGRAGRNQKDLVGAGFSKNKPIDAICFMKREDFGKIKDQLHKGRITWSQIGQVFEVIQDFYHTIKGEVSSDKPIIIPFNLLSRSEKFDGIGDTTNTFRLALYWLENIERIKLGFYAPGQILFTFFKKPEERLIESDKEGELVNLLHILSPKAIEEDSFQVDINELLNGTSISNFNELFKLLLNGQKKGYLKTDNTIVLIPTKKKTDELKYFSENSHSTKNLLPFLDSVFSMANELMIGIKPREQRNLDERYWLTLMRETVEEYFKSDNYKWISSSEERNKKIKSDAEEYIKKKTKFVFTLIDYIPKVKHKTIIEHAVGEKPTIQQLIYNGTKKHEEWASFLKGFQRDLYSLLKYLIENYLSTSNKRYNLSDLLIKLELHENDIEYVENLFSFAKWMGYLKYEGSILPMGVELTMLSEQGIKIEDRSSKDNEVYLDFEKTQKLRSLRLIAIECLSEFDKRAVSQETLKELKSNFISKYFECKDIDAVTTLLKETLGDNHPAVKALLDEALLNSYNELSEEQKLVYDGDINSNLQVIAGPGSGKTHTLVLRVARLVHTEGVKPENILVLAYNRAVVVELKERLRKLFNALGYSSITNRLKVFTFHGFCKFCLKDKIDNKEFAMWVPSFINIAKTSPGIINNMLGQISYVFVDEFQDITQERLQLLELIANPKKTNLTVIGDPNQSIYGYERVNSGGLRSPKVYYDNFSKIYNPKIQHLSTNFRSFPGIIEAAEKVIENNSDIFSVKKLTAFRQSDRKDYVKIYDFDLDKTDWFEELKTTCNEIIPESGKKYKQIALLFRSNREIYRAYNRINKDKIPGIRIKILGGEQQFIRIREVSYILEKLKIHKSVLLERNFVNKLIKTFEQARASFQNWDSHYFDMLLCMWYEFENQLEDDFLISDFLDFIEEVSNKDDGQLSKIYLNHCERISKSAFIEVILTTMHKVKGLEFDVVIVPPSFTDIAISSDQNDLLNEERRLMYVAYSRAKMKLVAINWIREKKLVENLPYKFENEILKKLGVPVMSGFDKFYISWGANAEGSNIFNFIEKEVKPGNELVLKFENGKWVLRYNNNRIGVLSALASSEISRYTGLAIELTGFTVTNIYKWSYEETVNFDTRNNTTYSQRWTEDAINRGYIYLVEFSGFGIPTVEL